MKCMAWVTEVVTDCTMYGVVPSEVTEQHVYDTNEET